MDAGFDGGVAPISAPPAYKKTPRNPQRLFLPVNLTTNACGDAVDAEVAVLGFGFNLQLPDGRLGLDLDGRRDHGQTRKRAFAS